MIYLDSNATTTLDPQALAAMESFWRGGPANPSSQHLIGRKTRSTFDDCIEDVLEMLSATDHRFVVTSGGTEANNWAIMHLGEGDGPLIVSQIEHPSILNAARQAEALGQQVQYVSVDSRGVVDLDEIRSWIAATPRPRLVSVMSANNETGVVQPIAEISNACNEVGVPFHTDASQMIGKMPFDVDALGSASATIAAHKFHGPVGVGGLLIRKGTPISPLLLGGAQQLGYRGGTEPTALVVGMKTAMQLCLERLDESTASMLDRRKRLESGLQANLPDLVIHGSSTERLPQTTCFSIPSIDRQALLMRLDFADIACSTGSACASGSSEPSHVLQAMDVASELVSGAIRLSGDQANTIQEIDTVVERIILCCNKLRNKDNVDN